jgi:hypothetical protein
MPFIQINGIILDKNEYEREVLLLRKLIEYEFYEIIRKYGFVKDEGKYLNKELSLCAKIRFTQLSNEKAKKRIFISTLQ